MPLVQATWWNESYSYRQPITLTACSATPANFQVKLNVTYNAHMQTDFEDVRFVDADDATPLDYWYKNYTNGVNAYMWIEVQDSIGPAGTNIYMYYGNAGVGNESNGNHTFWQVFDDFNDGNIDANTWTSGGASESGDWITITGSGSNIWSVYEWLRGDLTNMIFEYECNASSDGGIGDYWGGMGRTETDTYAVVHGQLGYYVLKTGAGCETWHARTLPMNGNLKDWTIKIDWMGANTSFYDWNVKDWETDCEPENYQSMKVRTYQKTITCNWAFARQWASCDAAGSFGAEEEPPAGPVGCTITPNAPANDTWYPDCTQYPTVNYTISCNPMPRLCRIEEFYPVLGGFWYAGDNITDITNNTPYLQTFNKTVQHEGAALEWYIWCTNCSDDMCLGGDGWGNETDGDWMYVDGTPPTTPWLWLPINETDVDTMPQALHWNESTDAIGAANITYDLYVDNNSDFSSPEVTITDTTQLWNITSMLGNQSWWWKVNVTDGICETTQDPYVLNMALGGGGGTTTTTMSCNNPCMCAMMTKKIIAR